MNNIDVLKQVLRKYKFEESVPDNIIKQMRRDKKAVFIQILKEQKNYSIFIFFVLTVYLWLRWLGMGISVAKSALLVVAAAIISAVMITTGSYYGIQYIISRLETKEQKQEIKTPVKEPEKVVQEEKQVQKIKPKPAINYKINIVKFSADAGAGSAAKKLTSLIAKELIILKGKEAANIIYSKKQIKSEKVLTGSVSKLADNYIIIVKIMNPLTSRVILHITEEVADISNLGNLAKKIAAQVAVKL